jgi:hypothetical protein
MPGATLLLSAAMLVPPTAAWAASETRRQALAVFLVEGEEPEGLSPAGQAARRDARRLRARFLDALRKVDEVVLVTDAGAAEARLEIREAAVHRVTLTGRTDRRGPKKPEGVTGGTIQERETDVGIGRVEARDYALTVRLTAGRTFADFSSDTRERSASSAVDTVVRALRRWVREHRRELARASGS